MNSGRLLGKRVENNQAPGKAKNISAPASARRFFKK
jgi:hypothetical protein